MIDCGKKVQQQNDMNKKILLVFLALCTGLLSAFTQSVSNAQQSSKENAHPKIVNIINFIRLLEPRDSAITEQVLYETVVKQIDIMRRYKLGGTFLLQYDALLDPRYQKLLKGLSKDSFEIGAWWEIPQPLVENAGMQ